MKKLFTFLFAACAMALTSCGGDDPEPNPVPTPEEKPVDISQYKKIDYKVRDLALIYQGGAHRIDWTEDEFKPYLTHSFMDGREEWLFDGYLFLEFCTGLSSEDHHFCANDYQPNARRQDYEWYLDRLFEKGKSLDALNKLITKKKQSLGDPGFKHKIALTTFVPARDQKDWGELDGKTMNFIREADRLAVCKWFIDQLVDRFNAQGYENLELYAIYMLCEDSFQIENAAHNFSIDLKRYCARKKLDYIWIPYFKAWGIDRWKTLGFDQVYHQPNHFFDPSIEDSRLDIAIEYSRELGISLEFECDENALSQNPNSTRDRMISYIDAFERHGVWYDTPIAYYTGNHLFLDFVRQNSPLNTIVFDRVCRHIVNRRLAAEQ